MQDVSIRMNPADAGVSQKKLDDLLLRVKREVDEGLLPSAQIAIAKNGKLVAFETFGSATNDSLYCVFSCTKAITAAAGWLLIQDGKLDVSHKVSDLIPEFTTNGKRDIRIEQLFTHTAGFPNAPFRPTDWNDKALRYQRFSNWTLNWSPGSRFEYHATSSMWVIAEIIERLSGESFANYVRTHIAEPLNLPDLYIGCPEEQHHRIAEISHVGKPMTSEDYAKLGLTEPPMTEVTEEALLGFNNKETRKVPVPGGGGIMSAAELALFYQGLIGNTQSGETIWSKETLKMATRVLTGGMKDALTDTPVNRALGVVLSGDDKRNLRGFGHTNSAQAFGHGGAGGQIAWVDQTTGISVGYCTNGHDRNPIRRDRRSISISNRAAVCAE
jgi:CubicO group peptidase (beta-lactamase class C family)